MSLCVARLNYVPLPLRTIALTGWAIPKPEETALDLLLQCDLSLKTVHELVLSMRTDVMLDAIAIKMPHTSDVLWPANFSKQKMSPS